MNENFNLLYSRVLDTVENLDLNIFNNILNRINSNTLCTGSGGSRVVAEFASEVLTIKNNILTSAVSPRDLLYMKLHFYKNILISSHSGNNYGVKTALNNDLNKFLLTCGQIDYLDINMLKYGGKMPPERSFISLGATLVPITVLLNYYIGVNGLNLLEEILLSTKNYDIKPNSNFEIMSGIDTKVATTYLDSTIVEAGLGTSTIHDKYDYCHGRSTLSKYSPNTLIYLINKYTELDHLLLKETEGMYKEIIVIDASSYNDSVIASYKLLIESMYLTKSIAHSQNKDLSKVEYLPIVKKIYKFEGEM